MLSNLISQVEDGIRCYQVTRVHECALLFSSRRRHTRSEEDTSELQSPDHLVCRRLLENKLHIDLAPDRHADTSGLPLGRWAAGLFTRLPHRLPFPNSQLD